MPTDYLVDCHNPEKFDSTIGTIGAAVLCQGGDGKYVQQEGHYIMRVYANEGYIEFAIKNQGYGTIVQKLDTLI